MTLEEIAEVLVSARRITEAATPGPYHSQGTGGIRMTGVWDSYEVEHPEPPYKLRQIGFTRENAANIAIFADPEIVTALLDVLDASSGWQGGDSLLERKADHALVLLQGKVKSCGY